MASEPTKEPKVVPSGTNEVSEKVKKTTDGIPKGFPKPIEIETTSRAE